MAPQPVGSRAEGGESERAQPAGWRAKVNLDSIFEQDSFVDRRPGRRRNFCGDAGLRGRGQNFRLGPCRPRPTTGISSAPAASIKFRSRPAPICSRLSISTRSCGSPSSCPVKGLELDEKTLALIDSDADGRVRVPRVARRHQRGPPPASKTRASSSLAPARSRSPRSTMPRRRAKSSSPRRNRFSRTSARRPPPPSRSRTPPTPRKSSPRPRSTATVLRPARGHRRRRHAVAYQGNHRDHRRHARPRGQHRRDGGADRQVLRRPRRLRGVGRAERRRRSPSSAPPPTPRLPPSRLSAPKLRTTTPAPASPPSTAAPSPRLTAARPSISPSPPRTSRSAPPRSPASRSRASPPMPRCRCSPA